MELRVAFAFEWAVEHLAKTLQLVLMSILIGVWQPTLLAFELVGVERVECEAVYHIRRLEVFLAVGAFFVCFQPPLDAFAAIQSVTSALVTLRRFLDHL